MVKAALILLALSLAGCAALPAPAPVQEPRRVWCDHNEPRRPSPAAVSAMSRAELDEVNIHNLTGLEWCGWTP